jgi:hypothetical protein
VTWNGEEGQHMLPQEEHEDSLDGQETEEEDDHTSKRRKLSLKTGSTNRFCAHCIMKSSLFKALWTPRREVVDLLLLPF